MWEKGKGERGMASDICMYVCMYVCIGGCNRGNPTAVALAAFIGVVYRFTSVCMCVYTRLYRMNFAEKRSAKVEEGVVIVMSVSRPTPGRRYFPPWA